MERHSGCLHSLSLCHRKIACCPLTYHKYKLWALFTKQKVRLWCNQDTLRQLLLTVILSQSLRENYMKVELMTLHQLLQNCPTLSCRFVFSLFDLFSFCNSHCFRTVASEMILKFNEHLSKTVSAELEH